MKRVLACISLAALTSTAAWAAESVKPTPKSAAAAHKKAAPIRVAPADEYFGKLKMSVLGIRNTIKDVGANLDIDQTRWAQLSSKAAFAEDAMHDWEKKYPEDTWLAKMVFALERMYAKLDSDEGRKRAIASMKWLVHDFPKSWYGRTGRKELALGKVGRPPVVTAAASPVPAGGVEAAPAVLSSAAPAASSAAAGQANASEPAAGPAAPAPVPAPSASP